jgi:hypothetical protein
MAIKLLALMVLSCVEVGLLVGATAAEPIVTNKPAASAIVLRSPVELKGTNVAPTIAKSSNQMPVLPRLTNTVENLSAEFGEGPLSESALHAERFEWMNERPMLQSRKMEPLRFLDRLPLRGGALFSRNPNARRNPLEVDGW